MFFSSSKPSQALIIKDLIFSSTLSTTRTSHSSLDFKISLLVHKLWGCKEVMLELVGLALSSFHISKVNDNNKNCIGVNTQPAPPPLPKCAANSINCVTILAKGEKWGSFNINIYILPIVYINRPRVAGAVLQTAL